MVSLKILQNMDMQMIMLEIYRFLNVKAKRIIMSRDARWLILMWKHYKKKHNYARRQVELFLDEEESLSLEGNEPVEN